jgi:hypothetical protein
VSGSRAIASTIARWAADAPGSASRSACSGAPPAGRQPGVRIGRRRPGPLDQPRPRLGRRRRRQHPRLATRAQGGRHRVGAARDQHEDETGARFLERLEQGVGGDRVHRLGRIDQHDPTAAAVGPHGEELAEAPRLLDLDLLVDLAVLVHSGFEPPQVGMRVGLDPSAGGTPEAGPAVGLGRLAQQRRGQCPRVDALADAGRPANQQRVGQPIAVGELRAQRAAMPGKLGVDDRPTLQWVAANSSSKSA